MPEHPSKSTLIAFTLVAGILFYLIEALWGAFFIHPVPMADNWCLQMEAFEIRENEFEEYCVKYLNYFEEGKYYHNKIMLDRNTYRKYSTLITGPFFVLLLFVWIPRRKNMTGNEYTRIILSGILASFVFPLGLSWVLPAPVHWFPEWIAEYHQVQIERALESLR